MYGLLGTGLWIAWYHLLVPIHVFELCKFKKAIYGLKQSPRTWFDKFYHFSS